MDEPRPRRPSGLVTFNENISVTTTITLDDLLSEDIEEKEFGEDEDQLPNGSATDSITIPPTNKADNTNKNNDKNDKISNSDSNQQQPRKAALSLSSAQAGADWNQLEDVWMGDCLVESKILVQILSYLDGLFLAKVCR